MEKTKTQIVVDGMEAAGCSAEEIARTLDSLITDDNWNEWLRVARG